MSHCSCDSLDTPLGNSLANSFWKLSQKCENARHGHDVFGLQQRSLPFDKIFECFKLFSFHLLICIFKIALEYL